MTRTFPALEVRFTPAAREALELRDRLLVALDDFGPVAIEEAAGIWRVFFDSPDVRNRALSCLLGLGVPGIAVERLDVEDDDWAARSQANLQPVRVGHVIVTPPWAFDSAHEATAGEDVIVEIVPSMGFGTGHHASTRLCLELLQQVPVQGKFVLDVGTGSGVLAAAACRLGASMALAIDNDPDAVAAARENVALNRLQDRVRVELADLRAADSTRASADLIFANLTGTLLRRRAADLLAALGPAGDCIVSGVLSEEERAVASAFEVAGGKLAARATEDEWVGMRFKKLVR